MNNNQYNPLEPEYGPNASSMLQSYRERAAQLRGELEKDDSPAYNPYQQETNHDESQKQYISDMEQWLSPVKMDSFNANERYTDEKHDNFMQNLEEDPAVKEYGEQFHTYLSSLMQAVQAGQLDQQQAMQMGQEYLNREVKPVIEKHHKGKGGDSFHKKRDPEIPDIVKKVRGIK